METPVFQPEGEAFALLGVDAPGQRQAIDALLAGLPSTGWQRVAAALQLSDQQLANAVSISISTLTRRKKEGVFTPEESDRLLRLAALAAKAGTVFTSVERVHAWFTRPNQQLGGESPLAYSRTSVGAAEVYRLLERILDGAPA
jgi:putative toxin-antitoxin system antitoxin component (TIGR02293 family)